MKKFFGEFKTFIMRGNVLDLAVGVIIGAAFSGNCNFTYFGYHFTDSRFVRRNEF